MDIAVQNFFHLLDANKDKNFIIWGAGKEGENTLEILEKIGIYVDCFLDKGCQEGEDRIFLNKKVYNPSILKKFSIYDTFIIIASMYGNEISFELMEMGYMSGLNFLSTNDLRNGKSFAKYHSDAKKYLDNLIIDLPLFKTIEIETINKCNNDCPFCPVNIHSDTREFRRMSDDLFYSILKQLSALQYSGHIAIFSNNEPYMDNRILEFIKATRVSLPEAYTYIYTNGTLLTLDKFIESMKWLDLIIIDNYNDAYEFLPTVREIYQYCLGKPDLENRVRICKRAKNEKLTTRGGQAPNRELIKISGITCLLPFQQFVVRPDGKVSLCCNDALGKYTLGDLYEETIIDVWYGKAYEKVRKKIYNGRDNLPLCIGCDSLLGRPTVKYQPAYGGPRLLNIG